MKAPETRFPAGCEDGDTGGPAHEDTREHRHTRTNLVLVCASACPAGRLQNPTSLLIKIRFMLAFCKWNCMENGSPRCCSYGASLKILMAPLTPVLFSHSPHGNCPVICQGPNA